MRLSLGSVAALAATVLIALAFWPDNRAVQGPQQLVAQDKTKSLNWAPANPVASKPTVANPATDKPASPSPVHAPKQVVTPPSDQKPHRVRHRRHLVPQPAPATTKTDRLLSSDVDGDSAIENALNSTVDAMFDPQPLKDAIAWIASRYQIPILFDDKTLKDASVDVSAHVRCAIAGLKLRDTLRILLRQLNQPLGFDIRDGVLRITTTEAINDNFSVVVYDCRDLLHLQSFETPVVAHLGNGMGAKQRRAPSADKALRSDIAVSRLPRIALVGVLKSATGSENWENHELSITEFGGLLVVRQTYPVHESIKQILADIRRINQNGVFSTIEDEHPPAVATPRPIEIPNDLPLPERARKGF